MVGGFLNKNLFLKKEKFINYKKKISLNGRSSLSIILKYKNGYFFLESESLTDKDFDASMYQTELFGIDLVISLGKPKYTYIDKQVIYMPVYLIYDSEVVMQMGVYEIASTELPNILDEDGDVDLDLLSPPLLYKSTTPTMIRKMLEEEINLYILDYLVLIII